MFQRSTQALWLQTQSQQLRARQQSFQSFVFPDFDQGVCNINLMNFSNYVNPFLPHTPFLPQWYCHLPPLAYYAPPTITLNPQRPAVMEIKNESDSNELDKEKLTQLLQKLHDQDVHHKKTHWTFEQDKLLQRLVETQKLQWKEIPRHFEGRTQNMCYSRYRRILMKTKQRSWSKQQEELVLELINRFGEKWKLISSQMPKFTSKQIRQRYLNYLRPNINKEDFSFEEDLKICEFVIQQGNHWRQMEDLLQGRPEGLLKGRYYGRLQKIIQECYKKDRN